MPQHDAVVVGGGFFGASIACYLKRKMGSVVLVEQEKSLLSRASYANQARVHNGYHYPRSLNTACRSHANFAPFVADFRDAVVSDFTKLYCIARMDSKVSPRQFERFCDIVGAPWKPARPDHRALFNPRLIEAVYEVTEYAFNSEILRQRLERELEQSGVEVRLGAKVEHVDATATEARVQLAGGEELHTRYVFNCTYAGLKRIPGLSEHCRTSVKLELAEMALIEPPPELNKIGITVMCGAYFSTMPFPARGLYTLSHVRYTPHGSIGGAEAEAKDPYELMRQYKGGSKALHMILDSKRYLPCLERAKVVDSLFEMKAILTRNEIDDGRPILMERSDSAKSIYSVMGGKLDNIYDVMERLAQEGF